jgi:putative transposase
VARRKVPFVQGNYYHVYNRGANRQLIFRSDENYLFLLQRVKRYAADWQVAVIAYCLMPNHYHFVLRQDGEHPLSGFIQAVFNSYTKAFNKLCSRSGTLFEGPFRALHVAEDEYLLHLCRYVHRNPLEAGLVTSLDDWPYSNYPEWIGRRDGTLIERGFVRGYFASPEAYIRFVAEYAPPKWVERAVRPLLCD